MWPEQVSNSGPLALAQEKNCPKSQVEESICHQWVKQSAFSEKSVLTKCSAAKNINFLAVIML